MRHMLGWILLLLATAVAAEGNSRIVATAGDSATELVLPTGSLGARICWYAGEKYSKGARIHGGGVWLECAPENRYETNGALSWQVLEAPPAALPVSTSSTD